MGSPSGQHPDDAGAEDPTRVDLGKATPDEPEAPFDPYRFGAPDVPPPPEYAPPGYVPPPDYPYPQQAGRPPADEAHGPYPPYPYGTAGSGTFGGQAPGGYGAPYGNPGQYPGHQRYQQYPGHPGTFPGAQQGGGTGKAVAAMVLGIGSIVFFWTTFFDAVLVIPAVVFGIIGLSEAKAKGGRGRGQAVAGLVCAGIGAVLAIVFTVWVVHLANQCGGLDQQGNSGFNQCVKDHM